MTSKPPHPPQRVMLFSELDPVQGKFKGNVRTPKDPSAPDLLVDNSPYSRIYHLAITDARRRPLYDLAGIAEPAGAICAAVNAAGEVALIRQWRPVPASHAGKTGFARPDTAARGFYSLEVPRGFPEGDESPGDAAAREAREELGLEVRRVKLLGWLNFNTAVVMTDIPVYVVLVGEQRVTDSRDEAEHIVDVQWHALEDVHRRVAEGTIRCGMTLSAIAYLTACASTVEGFRLED